MLPTEIDVSYYALVVNLSTSVIFLVVSFMFLELLRTVGEQVFKKAALVCLSTGSFGMSVHSLDMYTPVPLTYLMLGVGLLLAFFCSRRKEII